MRNLDCKQIKIFINLEIIGEEDKNKNLYIYIYIYIYFTIKRLKIFLQFGATTCCSYDFYTQLLLSILSLGGFLSLD